MHAREEMRNRPLTGWNPRGGVARYVAVYLAGVLPATMLWVCAPPSDHDIHT
jgi:hypothetical protein